MIVSYPRVNRSGRPSGAEVTFRFSDVSAIEHLTHYTGRGDSIDDEQYELIAGCVVVYVKDDSFHIQADYNRLKALMEQFEWNE
jgi:hypothetical protein